MIKRNKNKSNLNTNKYQTPDNDFSRVKTIPALKCMECQECNMESSGCCSNCSANQQYSSEVHCEKHNHSHNHQHSHNMNVKDYLPLLFLPMITGLITYKIIKKYGRRI